MKSLDRLQRQLVRAATEKKPRVPDAGRLLWRVFISLHNARTVTMGGAQAIGHQAIEAWARLTNTPLSARHVEILRAMDDAWLAKSRAKGADAPAARLSSHEATPELFDAVFA